MYKNQLQLFICPMLADLICHETLVFSFSLGLQCSGTLRLCLMFSVTED